MSASWWLVVEGNFDGADTDRELGLEAMTTIADRVEFTAVLDNDRRKVVSAVVIVSVLANLGLAQLTKLLGIDAHDRNVDHADLAIRASVSIADHHEGSLTRLASC